MDRRLTAITLLIALNQSAAGMTLEERLAKYKQGIQPIEEKTVHIEVIEHNDGGYDFCFDGSVVHPRSADYYDRRLDRGVYNINLQHPAPVQNNEEEIINAIED